MCSSLFGTDGVRGPAGQGILSSLESLRLGAAFSMALGGEGPRIALARDTRESGALLVGSVGSGIRAAGGEVVDLGVLPTPALSLLLESTPNWDAGIMVTASHNPWADNGLKFFGADGTKLSDEGQTRCERLYLEARESAQVPGTGRNSGGLEDRSVWASSAYIEMLAGSAGQDFSGRRIVVDHASGAAAEVLPEILRRLGAEVIESAPIPDGRNINEGTGAVHPKVAAARVVSSEAWAGVVVDGDGDRIVLVDEAGGIHDGDAIVGVLAESYLREGRLRGGAVVGTVTSNSGLEAFLSERGLGLVRTAVGDRHVAAAMKDQGCNLGGESSGHVLTPDLCPTGDGSRVALEVLGKAIAADRRLSEWLGSVPRFPVARRRVGVTERPALGDLALLQAVLREVEEEMADHGGRHLVRYSGTEPVLRLQVEGPRLDLVEAWADRLAVAAGAALQESGGE